MQALSNRGHFHYRIHDSRRSYDSFLLDIHIDRLNYDIHGGLDRVICQEGLSRRSRYISNGLGRLRCVDRLSIGGICKKNSRLGQCFGFFWGWEGPWLWPWLRLRCWAWLWLRQWLRFRDGAWLWLRL